MNPVPYGKKCRKMHRLIFGGKAGTPSPVNAPAPTQHLHLHIHGRVQGVFFRANAQKEATALGLSGWVRNTPDGGVEAVAEGGRPALEAFLAWCHRGPARAAVDRVDARWEPPGENLHGFQIRY